MKQLIPTNTTEKAIQKHGELADLLKTAKHHFDNRKSANTNKSYDADWKSFVEFCNQYDLCPLPAEQGTVTLYIENMLNEKFTGQLVNTTAKCYLVKRNGKLRYYKKNKVTIKHGKNGQVELAVPRKP